MADPAPRPRKCVWRTGLIMRAHPILPKAEEWYPKNHPEGSLYSTVRSPIPRPELPGAEAARHIFNKPIELKSQVRESLTQLGHLHQNVTLPMSAVQHLGRKSSAPVLPPKSSHAQEFPQRASKGRSLIFRFLQKSYHRQLSAVPGRRASHSS